MAGYCLAVDGTLPSPPFKGISDLRLELVACICIIGSAIGSWITMIIASILCQKFRGPLYKVPLLTYSVEPRGPSGDQSEAPTQPSNSVGSDSLPAAAGDAIVIAGFEKK